MDRKDVINAANVLKKYCCDREDCCDCMFSQNSYYCRLISYSPSRWKLPETECNETANSANERIADLHREIELRDRKLEELEQQLAIKDDILRKQAVMITYLEGKRFEWHGADEKPEKDGWYLCAAYFSLGGGKGSQYIYTPLYFSNSSWPVPFAEQFQFMAWAEIPDFKVEWTKND